MLLVISTNSVKRGKSFKRYVSFYYVSL